MEFEIQSVLDKIKNERIIRGVKQKEVAAFLDMDVRTYNNLENGKSTLTLPQLFKIAVFFKKEVHHFISENKNNHIENSTNSGVFYDQATQNNHSDDAIQAYKLLTEKLLDELKEIKSKI